VQDAVDFSQRPFRGLDEADPILGIHRGLLHAADVTPELLRYSQPGRVITGPISGRMTIFHRGVHLAHRLRT
jgi:hypothetical protein